MGGWKFSNQPFDSAYELSGRERFLNKIVGTQFKPFNDSFFIAYRGYDHHRGLGSCRIIPEGADHFKTICIGHHQVSNDQVNPVFLFNKKRFFAILGGKYLEAAFAAENGSYNLKHNLIIFGYKNIYNIHSFIFESS